MASAPPVSTATTPATMTTEKRLELITRRLDPEDVWGLDLIRERMDDVSKSRTLRTLWATSPTGRPHIGYFIPLLKMAEFLAADVEVIIILLDVYSFLDNVRYPMPQVLHRMDYYKYTVHAMLEMLLGRKDLSSTLEEDTDNADRGDDSSGPPRIRFIQESAALHFKEPFIRDQWRLMALTPQQAVRDAWDRSYNPDMLSPMLCPGLQTLAEEHLAVDFQFGGKDQKGIFTYAEKYLPRLGYARRAHLMNPMLPNLYGDKMSSSHPPHTKIRLLDDSATVRDKVAKAHERFTHTATAPSTTITAPNDFNNSPNPNPNPKANGILATLRDILIPISELQSEGIISVSVQSSSPSPSEGKSTGCPRFITEDAPPGTVFTVVTSISSPEGSEGEGEETQKKKQHFSSYTEIEAALADQSLDPDILAQNIAEAIDKLLSPLREAYEKNQDWQRADREGYPEEA